LGVTLGDFFFVGSVSFSETFGHTVRLGVVFVIRIRWIGLKCFSPLLSFSIKMLMLRQRSPCERNRAFKRESETLDCFLKPQIRASVLKGPNLFSFLLKKKNNFFGSIELLKVASFKQGHKEIR
jgi:hypothetical protein